MTPPAAAAAAPPVRRARTLTPGRPLTTAPRPRRVSGPAHRPRPAVPATRPQRGDGGLILGALSLLGRLAGHRMVDRLIRGRTWIAIVAFALIGIVTLQLGLLKLNAGIGRSLERGALLQTENAALSIENSELAAGGRVESAAGKLGMQIVPSGALKFLSARSPGDSTKAAAALASPIPAARSQETSSPTAAGEGSEAPSSGAESSTGTTPSEEHSGESSTATTSSSSSSSTSSASSTEASGTPSEATSSPAREAGAPSSESSAGAGAASGSEHEAAAGGGTSSGPAG